MNKYKMRFFEEPDDNKGGTAVFDPPAKVTTGEPAPKKDGEESPPEPTPTPPAPTVDAKELAKEFSDAIRESVGPKETKPQLTKEEAEKLLNVWKPSKEWVARFDNLETREAALEELRDGLVKQVDTISQHRLHDLETMLEKKFSPALEALEQMQNDQRDARFDTTYPQLAKPGLKKLRTTVMEDLVEQGKKFDNEGELFDAIAGGVEAVIKETNPDFKLEKTSGSSPAKPKANSSIPVTTPGAGGGTGTKGGSQTPAPKRGISVFLK